MARETLQARIAGQLVTIPVCWDPEKVAAARDKWPPDGIVDCDKLPSEKNSLANDGERAWFIAAARGAAGLAGVPKLPASMREGFRAPALLEAAKLAPMLAAPVVNRAPRT